MVKAAMIESEVYRKVTPLISMTQETIKAFWGTLRFDSLPIAFGAWPSMASPYIMREVEYRPELSEDAAAVSSTKFSTDAAAPKPARSNICTKGLSPGTTWRQGMTTQMAARAST